MEIIDCYTIFGANPRQPVDWRLATLLQIMEENQIDRALTCSLKGVLYDFAEGNDETLRAAREHPELVPMATIDPRRHLGCLEEVQRMADAGCRIFRFFPESQGWPVDFLPFLQLAERIEEQGGAILLPCRTNGVATTIYRLLGERSLPIVLCEVGYWNFAEVLACAQAAPNLHVETHLVDTPGSIEIAVQNLGAERLLLGTNAPEAHPASALGMVQASTLTAEQKEQILGGNAVRVLGLEP